MKPPKPPAHLHEALEGLEDFQQGLGVALHPRRHGVVGVELLLELALALLEVLEALIAAVEALLAVGEGVADLVELLIDVAP
jgi:hypothetical protein